MQLGAEGGVHDDPPVAQLVAEALDDDGAVVGEVTGGRGLLAQVRQQVVSGPVIEAGGLRPGPRRVGVDAVQGAQGAHEGAERRAELGGAAEGVAAPEGELAGLAGCGGDQHLAGADVLDAPRGGAQGEHVADARLVHHLLVELADAAARPVAPGEEDPVQPAVGDGAAGGHREALRAGSPGQGACDPVPDHAGAQLGELLGGVAAREHVEDRLEHSPGEPREGRGAAHEPLEVVDAPLVHRRHRHDLLGEDVERGGRHGQLLDGAGAHALGDHRGLHEVTAELREQHPVADRAHLVPRAPHPLQPAGHAGRGLHLHHEVDGAHVDAELQGGRRHDGGQAPRLQVVLDQRALLAADGAVVGAGEHRGSAAAGARLCHHLRGRPGVCETGRCRRAATAPVGGERGAAAQDVAGGERGALGGQRRRLGALDPDLVQAGGEPLGEAPGVGEDQRRAVAGDEVDDALLHRRPDRPLLRGGWTGRVTPDRGAARRLPQLGHVGHGHHDGQVPLLDRGGLDDRGAAATAVRP